MNLRFANFFSANGQPGPAVDIYDTPEGQAATPLLTNVAYGAVSAYAHPSLRASQPVVEFYVLPSGEDPVSDKADAQGAGGVQDDGSHPQVTFVFTADSGNNLTGGPLAGLSFGTQVEKGDFNGYSAPVAPAPPSGQGEILVGISPVSSLNQGSLGLYLMNDSSCDPPINGDTNEPGVPYVFNSDTAAIKSAFAIFPTSPGTHQVSIVAWTSSVPPTCTQLTAKQGATSIDITAGQQVIAYVYGTSTTDLHLATAPVQP